MNLKEEERRARLLKSRAERLPDIKKQFEEAQNRNFNSNFAPGGKDAKLVKTKKKAAVKKTVTPKETPKSKAKVEAEKRKVNLSVSAKKTPLSKRKILQKHG